jgi:cell pole-organizing protein PopZ
MPPPADRLRPAVPGAPSRVLGRPPGPSAPASALDALAAGLAASNATTGSASPATAIGAEPTPGVSAASRSLEDSVADMIKPMLQKWIDDNMPRIIEKALRNETGGGGKSGT